jgi:hypothetical protein
MSIMLKSLSQLALLIAMFVAASGSALASTPAHSVTVAAGPYIVDVNFMQYPPYVDQPLALTVVPHDHNLKLQGRIVAQPGLGTDAVPLHFNLSATGDQSGTLAGSIHMPVKGAWQIIIELNGPKGSGSGSVNVTVGAPGAMPFWLAWLIGSTPLLGVACWIWLQHRYRNKLAVKHVVSSYKQIENTTKE